MENGDITSDVTTEPKVLTLKERREAKRQEKLARKASVENKGGGSRFFLWLFVVIVLAAVVVTMARLAKNKGETDTVATTILESVTAKDWMRDNLSASTTLLEYSDFECPACRAYYPVLKQIHDEFGSKIRFVYRHFPLTQHANARLAARAAEAAGVQGKFWEMHDRIFDTQETWAAKPDAEQKFIALAEELGLDMTKFEKDMRSKSIGDKIDSHYSGGQSYGVNVTPTFFINNTRFTFNSFEEMKKAIQDGIDGNVK
ncbi:MAG TPA: DsbA family protein [Candidatus Paceibacterota bacterium]